jgi:TolB-like protein/DNA-binding winged helix-turn-helix (wHTH) protein/Tfp pilus assembly protein PilF
MNDSNDSARLIRFGEFEADLRAGLLRRRGLRVRLQEKPFQILAFLLERRGEVVTREELRDRLWPAGTYVDFDSSVNTALKKLRQALGDPADEPLYIKTVPRKGYRFIAPLEHVDRTSSETTAAFASAAYEPAAVPIPVAPAATFVREPWVWLATVATITIVLALSAYAWRHSQSVAGVRAAAGRTLLFVMPFDNLSGNPADEYFSDGLTDEMITELGRQYPTHLAVIARTSAMQYKGSRKPLQKIAAELGGIEYVLEGSVRRSASDVTINAQLFRVADGTCLWADSYTRPAAGVVSIQRDVVGRIAQSLAHELLPTPPAVPALASTTDPLAYDDYLRALFYLNKRSRDGQRKSFEYFQRSIARDPRFASAYSALAYAYLVSGSWAFMNPRDAFPKAKEAARKAVELDDSLAEAHVTLCEVLHVYEWNWSEAGWECRRALELGPNSAMVHKMYAEFLNHSGKPREAVTEIERAQKLDPLSLIINDQVGLYHMLLGEWDRAYEKFHEVVEMDPRFAPGHYFLGAALYFQDRYTEAIPEFETARKLSNDATEMSTKLACAYIGAGRRREALQLLEDLKQRAQREYVSPLGFAEIYSEMGDAEQTVRWIEKGAAEHAYLMMSVRAFSETKPVAADPRFQKVLASINFPDANTQLASVATK